MNRLLLSLLPLILFLFTSPLAYAREYAAGGGVAGIPEMLGGEARFIVSPKFHLGAGLGFFPVNGYLNDRVHLKSKNLGSGFEVTPTAKYSMNSFSGFVRYFPNPDTKGTGFFLEIIYSHWKGSSEVSGGITAGGQTIIPNALEGSLTLTQNLFGLMAGKEFVFGNKWPNFYIDIAGGLAYKTHVVVSTELSPNTKEIAGTLPSAQQTQLTSAITNVTTQTEEGLKDYNNIPVMPLILVGIGARF